MPCQSHPPWLGHSNYTWRSVEVIKLLIMQFYRLQPHILFHMNSSAQLWQNNKEGDSRN
jgi:hypothetical protein